MRKYLALLLALAMVLALGGTALAAEGFEPVVLVDSDEATVTVTAYDPDGGPDGGPMLELQLENKTDVELGFELMDLVVNGRVCGYWSEYVEAGAEMTSELRWQSRELEMSGVNYIETVSGTMDILDYDNYKTLETVPVELTLPTEGQEGPAVEEPTFDNGFEPVEVLATEGLRLTVVDYDPAYEAYSDPTPRLVLHAENDTDEAVRFTIGNVTVNGTSCSPYWGEIVPAGAESYSACEWWKEDLESAHVDEIYTVSFTASVATEDRYEEIFTSEPVTLTLAEGGEEAAAPVEGTVLVDDDLATVTVTAYDPTGSYEEGPAIELLMENKTDKALGFEISGLVVNGRVCGSWSSQVVAGSKSYDEITISPKTMARSGINYIETVTGMLNILDYETYNAIEAVPVTWTAPTEDQEGPAVEEPDYGHGFEPVEVLTADGMSVTVVDFDTEPSEDGYDGPKMILHAVNDTDRTVYFRLQDVTVNGTACSPYWSTSVPAGTEAYSVCAWWQDDLESAHVDEIYTVGFTVAAEDAENYSDLAAAPATLTLAEGGEEAAASAEGTLLVEGSLARLTATEYDPEAFSFEILTENLSDQELQFSLENVVVNGFATSTYWSTDVQPGMRSYEELRWSKETMELCGIHYIETVSATLEIYSDSSYLGSNELAWTAPTDGMEGPATEEPVFDNGYTPVEILTGSVTVTAVDYDPAYAGSYETAPRLVFFAHNGGSENMSLSIDSITVNGVSYFGGLYRDLPAGVDAYLSMTMGDYDLAEPVDEIETVTLTVTATPEGDFWNSQSQTVTLDLTGAGA